MKTSTNISGTRAIYALFTTFLLFVFLSNMAVAQSTWNADAVGGTVNWNTPGNWIGGVPDASKTVTIYNCNTCPRINTTGNQSKFVQVYPGGKLTIGTGGSLTIENPGGPGLKTHATSQVQINQGGGLTIKNFWGEGLAIGGTFTNGGTISINGGHTGIAVSAGASFTNNANGTTSVTGSSLNYGMTSSGTVLNNGVLTLDDANNDGISQQTGTITNGVNGTLTILKTGVNGIFAKGTVNNNGLLHIDNGLNGIYLLFGTFNNNANGELFVTGSSFLNEGIYIDPGTFKNSGELTIRNALSKGIEISSGSTFNNFDEITLDVPAWAGIFNVGGSNFSNKPCALIQSVAAIVNYATFTNSGIIFESAPGNSQIGQNNGTVINLNGGSFSVSGGNEVIAEGGTIVWTGCASTNFADANNWIPAALPTPGLFSKAVVQNVAQASGNAPRVSSTITSIPLYLHNGANLTVASGGTLSISDGMLGNGYLEVRQGGTMTVQAGGTFSSSSTSILGGSIQNSGTFNIPAPFHSAGSFGMNGGTFNNLSGGTFTGTTGQGGSGVNASLNSGATFTNSGNVTISGFGGFFLNQSTLKNNASGSIGMPSGGRISNLNGSTVTNNGSISIYRQSPEGIRCEGSTFTNTGGIGLSFTNIILFGGTFNNTGSISIASPTGDGIANFGTFSSSGNLSVQQSGTFLGIRNQGTFSTGAGSLTVLDHVNYGVVNFSTFSNGGILNINTTNAGRGIENNQGNFVNQTTGQISIQNTVSESMVNGANFTNNGQLTATGQGIATSVFFENTVFGSVTVHDVIGAGFHVFAGTCKNAGHISTDQTTSEGLPNYGIFTNLPTGSISVKNAGIAGLANYSSFTNQGSISVEDSPEGIRNLEDFSSSGNITLTNSKDIGWSNTGAGIFINAGNLLIDKVEGYGVVNSANTGYFASDLSGAILIKNTGDYGIFNQYAFYSSGKLTIQAAGTDAVFNGANGFFFNQPCGELNVENRINNTHYFQNEGLLRSTYTGTHINTSTLLNSGVIEDFYGSFNGLPMNNSAVRARPITGTIGGFIQNALEIGFSNPFQISSTWYADPNLTTPAGTYIPGVNTFQPTVGSGTHLLYFTAKDLVNGCTRTVSIRVSISSLIAGEEGNDQALVKLFNFPNPFKARTTINLSLPFDSEGKLIIFDNFGRQVELLYEGEMMKDELYQFEFDGTDSRVSSYIATLFLKNGRTRSIPLIKAEN